VRKARNSPQCYVKPVYTDYIFRTEMTLPLRSRETDISVNTSQIFHGFSGNF